MTVLLNDSTPLVRARFLREDSHYEIAPSTRMTLEIFVTIAIFFSASTVAFSSPSVAL
jgi:hypothetical protein